MSIAITRLQVLRLWEDDAVKSGRMIGPVRIPKIIRSASQQISYHRLPNRVREVRACFNRDWNVIRARDIEAEFVALYAKGRGGRLYLRVP